MMILKTWINIFQNTRERGTVSGETKKELPFLAGINPNREISMVPILSGKKWFLAEDIIIKTKNQTPISISPKENLADMINIKRKFVYGHAVVHHLNHPILKRDLKKARAILENTLNSKKTRCLNGLSKTSK